ncbi:hypothetical protein ACFWTC_37880 [Streptomyces sp. NPDC058619]|uniref:hypothetical protein n=1 Tax=Streptomyces sp. NPDC058619 TaxID=3346559 RepID=UPI003654DD15
MTKRPGLGRHQQTTLTLIQMREQHHELRRQRRRYLFRRFHTTPTTNKPGSYGLILCKPISKFEAVFDGRP